ncbi:MAG: hypothetical protein LC649_05010 [Bacteroidales bacterium]|nr:hypothetical protein [Bacteroidales bacterium]
MINRHITLVTLLITAVIAASSCRHIIPQGEDQNQQATDTAVSENYTGIKKYYAEGRLVKDITYSEGLKNGICNNYYDDGRLKRTIIYKNDLKVDTAKWYYPEGMVYRSTPYVNDMIHGVQTKYYKNGKKQAELPYNMGLRMPGLKEYYEDGRQVTGIPSITSDITDSRWEEEGILRVIVRLDNGSANVKFYRGALINGAFDKDQYQDITISSGMGFTEMKRSDTGGKGYVDIIAVYTTRFRNREIIANRIRLPYNNLI